VGLSPKRNACEAIKRTLVQIVRSRNKLSLLLRPMSSVSSTPVQPCERTVLVPSPHKARVPGFLSNSEFYYCRTYYKAVRVGGG